MRWWPLTTRLAGHYRSVIPNSIPTVELLIYAIFVTVVLAAVLTNPSGERHYKQLAHFYPWANESLVADAQMKVRILSSPSEQKNSCLTTRQQMVAVIVRLFRQVLMSYLWSTATSECLIA